MFSPDLFAGGSGTSGTKSFTDTNGAAYQVDWQVGFIDAAAGPGTPTSTTFVDVASGTVTYSQSNSIQGGAPNPFPSETKLSTGLSGNGGLNAVELDFSNSTTPITDFGVFVGDLESRPNNGTVGRVLVYDLSGTLIQDEHIIYTGTVLNGTNYTVTEPLGSPSGPTNNTDGDWGDDTTAFISVSASQPIGKVVFHVGDDDHTSSQTGTTEQLGLVGFLLPDSPAAISSSDFGDAPISYDDTDGSGAIDGSDSPAEHAIANTLHLGSVAPDDETAPQSSANADGDDDATVPAVDDEDSITTFPAIDTDTTSYSLDLTVNNDSGSAANVYAWIDFDGDGEFDEDERATVADGTGGSAITLAGGQVPTGSNGTVTLNWTGIGSTNDIINGDSFVRVRVTTDALAAASTAATRDAASVSEASDGEVEDFPLAIAGASPAVEMCTISNDITFVPLSEENTATGLLGWPTTTGTSTRTYTNVNGTGIDIRATTYDTDGATLTDQVRFLPFAGSLRKGGIFRRQAAWQLSLEFFETGTTTPAAVSGINHVVEDFEAGGSNAEQIGDFEITPVGGSSTLLNSATEVTVVDTYSGSPTIVGNFFQGLYASASGPQPEKWAVLEAAASQVYTRIDVDLQNGNTLNPIINLCRPAAADTGDAPVSYGDARHPVTASSSIYLGNTDIPDIEFDAPNSANGGTDGDGDDNTGIDDEDGVALPASITIGSTISLPVTVTGSGALNAWLDWDGNGTFDAGEQIATDIVDGDAGDTDGVADGVITLSVSAPGGATVGTTHARFRYSSDTGLEPTGAASDGEVEDYQVAISSGSTPEIKLVKRITAVNGIDITGFDDNDARTEDEDPNWPTPLSTYLRGSVSSGIVGPGDQVEFTIYFLSSGSDPLGDLTICDLIPANMSFDIDGFVGQTPLDTNSASGTYVGIALASDDASLPSAPTAYLTNTDDGDRGRFYPPDTEASASCNQADFTAPLPAANNPTGAVVVEVVSGSDTLPAPTGPGAPADTYGFIRFRAVTD